MDDIKLYNALNRLLSIKVRKPGYYYETDEGATLAATRLGIQCILDMLSPNIGTESITDEEELRGPENSREEVVGTSTSGKNTNFSSIGFSGGIIGQREAA